MSGTADFLLELLSEEIPARMQAKARNDLARLFAEELGKAGLAAEAIETFATKNFGLGGPEDWRKPAIVADAVVALLAKEPSARMGKAWIDEAVLREEGVTDFTKYQCSPGHEPPHFPFAALSKTTSTGGGA